MCAVGVTSDSIVRIPNFVKICHSVQKCKGGIDVVI
jgi:hypothetical protein